MPVQRIKSADGSTCGWQARVYTVAPRYVSEFFADRKRGGTRKAREMALGALARLERRAARLRRSMN